MGNEIARYEKIRRALGKDGRNRQDARRVAGATEKTKLLRASGGETERIAETEHDAIVELPMIVGIRPIVVEPQLAVIVALHIEDVRVVVRVRIVRRTIRATAHRSALWAVSYL